MSCLTRSRCLRMSFILCIVGSGCCAPPNSDDVTITKSISSVDQFEIMDTYSAAEMCHEYSKLIYTTIKDPILLSGHRKDIKIKDCYNVLTLIVNGTMANPKEFPHMALLGYSRNVKSNAWACGGSLISNRWILSAAHCDKLDDRTHVRWARLGDLNYLSDTDLARPKNYKIIQRVVHPDYHPPSLYNDIALFRLEKNVEFSAFVRPICLNADPYLPSTSAELQTATATGWGQIKFEGPSSPDLLKVTLNIISQKRCNTSYVSLIGPELSDGILDSMLCAGYLEGKKDTCGGDSGGPIQMAHGKYDCMYTQIGITSFGRECAKKNSPGVYTRVSKYLPWIEQIVWPKSD